MKSLCGDGADVFPAPATERAAPSLFHHHDSLCIILILIIVGYAAVFRPYPIAMIVSGVGGEKTGGLHSCKQQAAHSDTRRRVVPSLFGFPNGQI
jgi:hypothetical protein